MHDIYLTEDQETLVVYTEDWEIFTFRTRDFEKVSENKGTIKFEIKQINEIHLDEGEMVSLFTERSQLFIFKFETLDLMKVISFHEKIVTKVIIPQNSKQLSNGILKFYVLTVDEEDGETQKLERLLVDKSDKRRWSTIQTKSHLQFDYALLVQHNHFLTFLVREVEEKSQKKQNIREVSSSNLSQSAIAGQAMANPKERVVFHDVGFMLKLEKKLKMIKEAMKNLSGARVFLRMKSDSKEILRVAFVCGIKENGPTNVRLFSGKYYRDYNLDFGFNDENPKYQFTPDNRFILMNYSSVSRVMEHQGDQLLKILDYLHTQPVSTSSSKNSSVNQAVNASSDKKQKCHLASMDQNICLVYPEIKNPEIEKDKVVFHFKQLSREPGLQEHFMLPLFSQDKVLAVAQSKQLVATMNSNTKHCTIFQLSKGQSEFPMEVFTVPFHETSHGFRFSKEGRFFMFYSQKLLYWIEIGSKTLNKKRFSQDIQKLNVSSLDESLVFVQLLKKLSTYFPFISGLHSFDYFSFELQFQCGNERNQVPISFKLEAVRVWQPRSLQH